MKRKINMLILVVIVGAIISITILDVKGQWLETKRAERLDSTIHTLQAQHLTDSIRIEYLDGRIDDSLNYAR